MSDYPYGSEKSVSSWIRTGKGELMNSNPGQFAEVVYATTPLDLLLKAYDSVNQQGFPLEGYYALSPQPYMSSALPLSSVLPLSDSHSPKPSAVSSGVQLLKSLKGQVAKLPAAVFSRWIHEHGCVSLPQDKLNVETRRTCSCAHRRQQIIVSICGTSSVQQAIQDLRAIRRPYPCAPDGDDSTVHTGFWDLYQGMKSGLIEGIQEGLRMEPPDDPGQLKEMGCLVMTGDTEDVVRELVVTGHSMGGAIAHLLCIDLLSSPSNSPRCQTSPLRRGSYHSSNSSPGAIIPSSLIEGQSTKSFLRYLGFVGLEIVTFGEPRTGNQAFVDLWVELKRQHQELGIPIREWCIKAYNDGVPSLPLMKFGYRHFCQEPLYTINGKVYRVPSDQREYALFHVTPRSSSTLSCPSSRSPSDSDPERNASQCNSPTGINSIDHNSNACPLIPLSPLGGHNYYNERDLEGRYLRRMLWLEKSGFDQDGWEDRYREIIRRPSSSLVDKFKGPCMPFV
ncbi:hypothetical protein AN958_09976 [Leucoagaricus sp. SymC.cos]|nr:hypothetical protein AN958_09976 [Leucoagaricus sp. SymC.cos]